MPLAEKIQKYSVWVSQNNYLNWVREISLTLESGAGVYIGFPQQRPDDWLQFVGADVNLFMTQDEFDEVYHLLQSENPVFFTALDIDGFQIGAVHTNLNVIEGVAPGDLIPKPQNISSLVRRAIKMKSGA
jgi:hypothetical protein